MAASTVEVGGLSELLANLRQLPREMVSSNGGLVRSALFQAAKLMRDDIRRRSPQDTGNLSRNVIAKRDSNPRAVGASERYLITVRQKRFTARAKQKAVRKANGRIDYRLSGSAYYWRFVEFGTAKMAAEPFLRPGFESQKEASVAVFKSALTAGLQRTTAKLRKASS